MRHDVETGVHASHPRRHFDRARLGVAACHPPIQLAAPAQIRLGEAGAPAGQEAIAGSFSTTAQAIDTCGRLPRDRARISLAGRVLTSVAATAVVLAILIVVYQSLT